MQCLDGKVVNLDGLHAIEYQSSREVLERYPLTPFFRAFLSTVAQLYAFRESFFSVRFHIPVWSLLVLLT
jgi:hypothetical protein